MTLRTSPTEHQKALFLFFFFSGFCSLLYQVVWLRLAFASFGVITPVLSIVISVFMAGLAIGSWTGGGIISRLKQTVARLPAIRCYALAELLTALGALAVPRLFALSERYLLFTGQSDSGSYLLWSAALIAIALLPSSLFMGMTFPFGMAHIREVGLSSARSFGILYLANVLGAMSGVLMTALVLIELAGLRGVLRLGSFINVAIAVSACVLSFRIRPRDVTESRRATENDVVPNPRFNMVVLFIAGFVSLAMEVSWIRAFTPVLGTQVYAFASVLFVYLLATSQGSSVYQRRRLRLTTSQLMALAAVFVLIPVVFNEPRWHRADLVLRMGTVLVDPRAFGALLSIFPFCAVLGCLTPQLVDEVSGGDPARAGKAYALNVVGCIVGPLFASYLLLPKLGAKASILVLSVPLVLMLLSRRRELSMAWRSTALCAFVALLVVGTFFSLSYEVPTNSAYQEVRRDYSATTVSAGTGREKKLLVNGLGLTHLTPVTKYMAHLPLALHQDEPKSALVICLGMGTTFRSLLSWNVQTTAVELLPSVKDAFGFYFDDAEGVLSDANGQIVVDDGRRFLRRTRQTFDVITIDPPPPAEAAGSSLLYSEEFYELAKLRLNPGGILQQWFAVGDKSTLQAVTRSLSNSFPNVKAYRSIEGWGHHFLASMSPLVTPSAEVFASRMPHRAQEDLIEWTAKNDVRGEIARVLEAEVPLDQLRSHDPGIRITDDRPFNEYYLLRRILGH